MMAEAKGLKSKERVEGVQLKRQAVLARYQELQAKSLQRRQKLEQAKLLQLFQRDASGLEAWIADKTRIASDESYKDRRNLQGKLQKHHAFEAEIAAHNNSIIELKDKGRKMINSKHFADEKIKERLDEIAAAWESLRCKSAEKRQKLLDSQKREDFVREADEVATWITDKVAIASSEEAGKDLEHVELLQKKFKEFMKDIQSNEGRIKGTKQLAQKLLKEEHPDSELIISKQKLVDDSWEVLNQFVIERQKKLKGAHEIQIFNRTVEETASWMNEKAATAQSDEYGRDLASVQGLLRKHDILVRDLDALETKVQELGEEANNLKHHHAESSDQIAAKHAQVTMLWEALKHQASKRGSKLEDSQKFQKFLADHRELVSWVNDMMTVIEATELAKDLSGAESLLQSHKERKGEVDAHEDNFKATMQFGQSLISFGHFASEDIKDKLSQLAGKKADLITVWEQRKKEFEECLEYVAFLRETENIENWIAKQESVISSEKEGDSLESAEALLKKHEDFQKSLVAQEEKFKALNELADNMIAADHYASTDIANKRESIQKQQDALLKLVDKQQAKLQDNCQLQQFFHDVEEISAWISEKKKIATDEAYRDPSNLEAKKQQHHTFEGELQANRHRMEIVVDAGHDLVSDNHFASDKIIQACQNVKDQWEHLETLTVDKGQKLQQAHDQQQFDRSVKDMEIWLDEVDKQLSSEELGKDLVGVKKLQKKLLHLETDISVHKDQFDALSLQAKQLTASEHFDAEAIQEKQTALMVRYEGLHKPLQIQKERLEASLKLQQFIRDVDDEEAWIKDREPLANLSNRGADLTSVQHLQKKHNALMTEIANHESQINLVLKEGQRMKAEGHYGEEEIHSNILELQQQWEELKKSADVRKQQLVDSFEAQQYFADALEAELRIKELEPVVRSSDFGKDKDMADALMKKHEALLNEIEVFGTTIQSLAERSVNCDMKVTSSVFPVADRKNEKPNAKALFNYTPSSQREMPLKKGETVTILNSSNKEWWKVSNSSGVTGFVPANHLKIANVKKRPMSASRKQSFSMSVDINPQVSIADRQGEIKRKYDTLLHLAKERKQRLTEATARFTHSSQINELQHWINDKLSFVTSEEAGRDFEHVVVLKKKFETFQKELPNMESKLMSIQAMAEDMVDSGHNEAEEIKMEMEDLNQQWDTLVQATTSRKHQLEGAFSVQTFNRAADETKLWMNEKITTLQADDYGRDLGSVQALQRKHEGFETDLVAIEEKVKSLSVEAGAICRTQPQSVMVIKSKEKEVSDSWNSLKARAEAHKKKLEDSHDLQSFLNDYRDLMTWVSSMQALVSSQEVASDVASAETLLNRHKELKNEIEAKKPSIQSMISFGKQLLSQSHYAASTIQESIDSLAVEVPSLDKAWATKKHHLDQCLDLQLFNRDCEQVERWMGKKEAFLSGEEMTFSKSLDSVEVLIKKHKDFDKSLQVQEVKIVEVQKFADRLFQAKHYAAVEIAERRASVLARWARLKQSLVDWRSRLGQSQSFQQFKKEADELDAWFSEKVSTVTDESYRDPTNLSAKLKKHEAFQAEVLANKDRVFGLIENGKDMIETQKCPGLENDVDSLITSLKERWDALNARSADKTQKLTEASQEQLFNETTKEIEFWLQDMETKLTTEELGHDISSVDLLLKKQQLHEADIEAHKNRIGDLKKQAQKFFESAHFDAPTIQMKKELIDSRYAKLQELATGRRTKLQDSLILQQFYSSIHEEEAWIKEKNLLVSSTDYGRDLFGVRKHKKNHQQLMKEMVSHEESVQGLLSKGDELAMSDHYAHKEIRSKCEELQRQWQELSTSSSLREKKLEESLAYQEFCAVVSEEESWIAEKTAVQQSEDFGDSLGAVQNLLRKHETFETDLATHKHRAEEIEEEGMKFSEKGNYYEEKVKQTVLNMKQKFAELENAASIRKQNIVSSDECLKFNWEADIADSWIKSKYAQLHVEEYGRDILSVQRMLTKHETLENALATYKKESIDTLLEKKNRLLGSSHAQSRSIQQKHDDLMRKWDKLQKDSDIHRSRLQRNLDQFKKVEELFLEFARKSSRFLTDLKNIEEDLIDSVKCNTLEEIQAIKNSVNPQLQQAINQARADLKQIGVLDRQIKTYGTLSGNPYTWVNMDTLDESMQNVVKLMKERDAETSTELYRQNENDDKRKLFAKHANSFNSWLSETRTALIDSSGTLESQLQAVQTKAKEIEGYHDKLKVIEELGVKVEEALIFDNKYTEHTPVSLGQQWDELRQMVMRIQHNIEQQIQARNITGVTEEQLREFTSNFKHFDKNANGKLEHIEFKTCLRSLGYNISTLEQGQIDVEFERILDIVDANRRGYITFEEYMTFVISKESDNMQSITEIEEAFRAIVADKDRPYVKREELLQALSPEQFEYCIKKMKVYQDSTGNALRNCYDHKAFAQSLF